MHPFTPLLSMMPLRISSLLFATLPPLFAAEEKLTFNRDVRPIVSDKCFACHRFDPKHREGGRRLDTPERAYADNDGVVAIKPGDLAKSDAWLRIISEDQDEVPPAAPGVKVRNVLDAFILARLKKEGLAQRPEADQETLIRRVTLALTGLPPSVDAPVHLNDLNVTILHCLGIDHSRFTFQSQGLDHRLTGVEPAQVVKGLLA